MNMATLKGVPSRTEPLRNFRIDLGKRAPDPFRIYSGDADNGRHTAALGCGYLRWPIGTSFLLNGLLISLAGESRRSMIMA